MLKRLENTNLHHLVHLIFLCVLCASMVSCGFKLRGAVELPADLQKIFIVGSVSSELVRDLKNSLQYSATVVKQQADADAILSIVQEESTNRTLSVDSNGRIREAELQYSVTYNVKKANGDTVIDNDTLLLARDYINDENDVIGRTNESNIITRDLKRDAAQQILRRLHALSNK
jgi:LPS-assembly lipoprotein